ncbi:hypothetical protein [Paenibacillus sp. DMB5]|uniref:DUF6843 domain-containing protein n=1 Tax=Paenibacillus sp. DMB5 TaxID=1780103 RepID=UPI00076C2551|nr:hypothetical protein [Paenibacillus sp. DMB5]KUP23367.1 hypothetical protein AWJ19_28730 [Paenibacillus sp. DMB5]
MAHFRCNCGEVLGNGLVPNDVQIHVFKNQTWINAVNNHTEVYLIDKDYDIWKCPVCERVYSFKNKVDKMFALEDVEIDHFTSCLCGEHTNFAQYVAYTDIEMDRYTSDAETANELPDAPRELWSCNNCNRFFLKEIKSTSIQVYHEIDYYKDYETMPVDTGPQCIFLIPDGFAGPVEIIFGQDSYPYIELINNQYVFEIPVTGVLKVSNKESESGYAEDEYYFIDCSGNRIIRAEVSNHIITEFGNGTVKEKFTVKGR